MLTAKAQEAEKVMGTEFFRDLMSQVAVLKKSKNHRTPYSNLTTDLT
jgi:hypothetical protein